MSSDGTGPPTASGAVCYLVLAHRRPDQVARLASRILDLSPHARVLIHWDARSQEELEQARLPAGATVIAERIAVRWGRWSMVQATLALLRAATDAGSVRWSVVISGEDWPATDLAGWERNLYLLDSDAVISAAPLVDRWAAGEIDVPLPEDEVRRYGDRWHLVDARRFPRLDRVVRGLARRAAERVRPRGYPAAFDFYGRAVAVAFRPGPGLPPGWEVVRGDQWVTLGPRAVRAVLHADPRVSAHFRHTLIPDEAFVQTIVRNTPGLRVTEGRTSFAPWAHFGREPSLVLRPEDLADVASSGAAFARKVGDGDLARVTDHLDRLVAARWAP